MADPRLVQKVKDFLRVSDDDTLQPLILAAEAYLANAGVMPPEEGEGDVWMKIRALYELAITLYVSLVYSGGGSNLEPAMTAIILQIKNYGR